MASLACKLQSVPRLWFPCIFIVVLAFGIPKEHSQSLPAASLPSERDLLREAVTIRLHDSTNEALGT